MTPSLYAKDAKIGCIFFAFSAPSLRSLRLKFRFNLILFLCFLLPGKYIYSQDLNSADELFKTKKEIYFRFEISQKDELKELTRIISIDNVYKNCVYAYANKDEFQKFLNYKYDYTILKNPYETDSIKKTLTSVDITDIKSWDFYPTYEAYESMMYQFETDYPNLCKIESIGTLPSGKKLLVAKISDNADVRENEPQFLYTSSMHGDETGGYILMLRLIDYLLSNYGTDSSITGIVNNIEIWINPLANPDGTYAGGNNTVSGATRYNINGIDLNRNYHNPEYGVQPVAQPETQAFINFAANNNFVMSVNFHAGAEVVNYPWDTWEKLHADDNWWIHISREYADTVHANSPPGYMTDLNNGITNGYQWYPVYGSRQDYMNYYLHCRELTIELSETHLLPEIQLENLWNYNYKSLLNYMKQSIYGISGIVTDSVTGEPIISKVFIQGHDADSSDIYSSLPIGNYYRPVYEGIYSLTFSAPGYISKNIDNITTYNDSSIFVDAQLAPVGTSTAQTGKAETTFSLYSDMDHSIIRIDYNFPSDFNSEVFIYDITGKAVSSYKLPANNNTLTISETELKNGIYFYKVIANNRIFKSDRFTVIK